MAETVKARIGFVSGGSSSMPHYGSFLPLVPNEVKLEHEGLELYRESLYQIADKKEQIVRRVQEFVTNKNWDGVILTASRPLTSIRQSEFFYSRPSMKD